MVMASLGGLVGCGESRCCGRLTAQLLILRLMTRGLVRSRRFSRGSARISATACSWAVARHRGGKSRVGAGAASCGPEASGERQSVGVDVGLQRGVVHQATDRVVGAQEAVGLLVDAVGALGAQYHARATLMGLQLIDGALKLPAF